MSTERKGAHTAVIDRLSPIGGQSVSWSAVKTRFLSSRQRTIFAMFFLFFLAFALRAIYDGFILEHRICHFGDAYNFLRSGSAIYEAVASSSSLPDFLDKVYGAGPVEDNVLHSMTSMKLQDRLQIDGPVFPSYLAMVQWLAGVDPKAPLFDSSSLTISLCNALLDSLTCLLVFLCGRLAFNNNVAFIAGLLFAIYPAAIINTQHCYSEPFSYFLLSVCTYLCLSLLIKGNGRAHLLLALGLCCALLMLSKPAFVVLPAIIAFELLLLSMARKCAYKAKFYLPKLGWTALLLLLGAAFILGPWAYFNKTISGNWSISVNRVPAFNLFHGNQIRTDGWRTYPFPGNYPSDNQVLPSLVKEAQAQPLAMLSLQIKKQARMWSGVWNEYHYKLFGLSVEVQSFLHQLLLVFALIGLSFGLRLLPGFLLSRSFQASLVLGTICLFHFAYTPFEAISRYAITAIPSICLLAAFALGSGRISGKVWPVLILSILALSVTNATGLVGNAAALFLPDNLVCLAPWLAVLLSTLVLGGLYYYLELKFGLWILRIAFAATLCVLAVYSISSDDWRELKVTLSPGDRPLVQHLRLPVININNTAAFVLVDMNVDEPCPRLRLALNGQKIEGEPFPLAQLMPYNEDILQCLAIQAEGMGKDIKSFRHWWVLPVPPAYLKAGFANQLSLSSMEGRLTIYGDKLDHPGMLPRIPALSHYSYTKGFTTFDHNDPRIKESYTTLAPVDSSRVMRVRLLLVSKATLPATDLHQARVSIALMGPGQVQMVSGQDPKSFSPPVNNISLGRLASGSRFGYSMRYRGVAESQRPGFVSLSFQGLDGQAKPQRWNSVWQPIGIKMGKQWQKTSFSDFIPDSVLSWTDTKVSVLFSPFQPDLLFLKKKEALKARMEVKEATLYFEAPLGLAAKEKRQWHVY